MANDDWTSAPTGMADEGTRTVTDMDALAGPAYEDAVSEATAGEVTPTYMDGSTREAVEGLRGRGAGTADEGREDHGLQARDEDAGALDLDGAFDLMRRTGGAEALGDLVERACPDSTPWRRPDGTFDLDPADLFDRGYELDEWLVDAVRETLNDARDLEAYGKTFTEATRGMGAREATEALADDVELRLMTLYRDASLDYEEPSWRSGERDELERALAQALGREVDLSDASQAELLDRLDEQGLAIWSIPDVSQVEVPCDVMLGDPDLGLGAEGLYDLLCSRETPLSDIDPSRQTAREFGGGFAANLVEDVASSLASAWGSSVGFPCTLTAEQAVGLTHGGAALALGARDTNERGAWLGSFDPYMGSGGTMELTLARDLVVDPSAPRGELALRSVRAVDPSGAGSQGGRPYSIGDTFGAAASVYDVRLAEAGPGDGGGKPRHPERAMTEESREGAETSSPKAESILGSVAEAHGVARGGVALRATQAPSR